MKRGVSKDSIKFCYGIRVALGITLAYFIITYFKISEGRWILLTVFSLINPIYEVSKKKVVEKFIETILGAVVIMVTFTVFKNIDIREFILLIGCYFITCANNSRIRAVFATVLAIGIVAISGNSNLLSMNRIVFVGVGAVIAIIINKLVLPFNVHSSNRQLVKMYKVSVYEMLKELADSLMANKNDQVMKNIFINTSLIEDKLKENNCFSENMIQREFIDNQRLLVCSIYDLYTYLSKNIIKEQNVQIALEDMNKIINYDVYEIEKIIETIKVHIKKSNNIIDKITLSNIVEILTGIEEMKKF